MFCKYCGENLDDQAKFCSKCGKLVEVEKEEENFFDESVYVNPIKEEEKDGLAGKILSFGIWGLIFSILSFIMFSSGFGTLVAIEEAPIVPLFYYLFTLVFPILGLIFSSIARKRIKVFIKKYGETEGKASVGKGLSIPAKIISIIMLVLTGLFILIAIASFLG